MLDRPRALLYLLGKWMQTAYPNPNPRQQLAILAFLTKKSAPTAPYKSPQAEQQAPSRRNLHILTSALWISSLLQETTPGTGCDILNQYRLSVLQNQWQVVILQVMSNSAPLEPHQQDSNSPSPHSDVGKEPHEKPEPVGQQSVGPAGQHPEEPQPKDPSSIRIATPTQEQQQGKQEPRHLYQEQNNDQQKKQPGEDNQVATELERETQEVSNEQKNQEADLETEEVKVNVGTEKPQDPQGKHQQQTSLAVSNSKMSSVGHSQPKKPQQNSDQQLQSQVQVQPGILKHPSHKVLQRQSAKLQDQNHKPPKPCKSSNQYSRLHCYRILFQHYSKVSYTTGRSMTFQRMQYETNVLNINKFMVWCKDFKITGEVSVTKLLDIFKKSASNYKEMNLEEFMVGVSSIASEMFKSKKVNATEALDKFVHVDNDSRFKQKCKELNISLHKPSSQIRKIRIRKLERVDQSVEGIKKVKSESIRKKMLSSIDRYPDQRPDQEMTANLRAINKSMNSNPIRHKIQSQQVSVNMRTHGRTSKAQSLMQKYHLNTVLSQAKNEVNLGVDRLKRGTQRSPQRLQKLQVAPKPQKSSFDHQAFLSKLLELDQQDQFLAAHERQQVGRRVPLANKSPVEPKSQKQLAVQTRNNR